MWVVRLMVDPMWWGLSLKWEWLGFRLWTLRCRLNWRRFHIQVSNQRNIQTQRFALWRMKVTRWAIGHLLAYYKKQIKQAQGQEASNAASV